VLLTEREIQQAIEQVKTNFPHFTDWEYNNEKNEDYFGFALWGEFIFYPENNSNCFFITFDTSQENWQGALTTGQPSYLWTSADVGDAHLVSTESCQTLEEAIAALKAEMVKLFSAFSVV
jgi:hypothetical protein